MEINRKSIQIRGKSDIEQELSSGDDVTITVTVTDVNDHDNNDGTLDRTYKAELFVPAEWDGKVVNLKGGKMSLSQEQRWELFRYWEEKTDQKIPFEKYYQAYMRKKIDEVIEKRQ